ncbi:hypothetical protein LEP1GSC186_4730 [Leptospira noguchii serovar Autumnalis str. ZUN142]|uniref:Uncharacterized protein n=1 Tax=Leptospira noguchii serovar Autumnalis str. ZUN142 TaxID=1085540 RepID=M6UUT7_9LEPT|nr:hypothetical protein LEP1GSC186_4730 [Leptospira noguchii serovar Autumnalis str. ZUN142]
MKLSTTLSRTQRLASIGARSKLSVSLPELSKTLFTKAF